jgi:hypothetical protein
LGSPFLVNRAPLKFIPANAHHMKESIDLQHLLTLVMAAIDQRAGHNQWSPGDLDE